MRRHGRAAKYRAISIYSMVEQLLAEIGSARFVASQVCNCGKPDCIVRYARGRLAVLTRRPALEPIAQTADSTPRVVPGPGPAATQDARPRS